MKYHCCDPRRLEVLRRSGSANAIDFLEVLDRAAPPGVPRQRTLFVRLLRDGFSLSPDNLRIAAASASHGRHRLVRSGGRTAGRSRTRLATASRPRAHLVIRTTGKGFSATPCRWSPTRAPIAPPGFDRSVAARLLVQGRMPLRFRLRATLPCPRRPGVPESLPGKGLPRFPTADARPHGPAGARLARAFGSRPRRHPGRAAGLRRRQPVLPPGRDRQRGLPVHGAQARLGSTPCAAGRLPPARRLQRARLGPPAARRRRW